MCEREEGEWKEGMRENVRREDRRARYDLRKATDSCKKRRSRKGRMREREIANFKKTRKHRSEHQKKGVSIGEEHQKHCTTE